MKRTSDENRHRCALFVVRACAGQRWTHSFLSSLSCNGSVYSLKVIHLRQIGSLSTAATVQLSQIDNICPCSSFDRCACELYEGTNNERRNWTEKVLFTVGRRGVHVLSKPHKLAPILSFIFFLSVHECVSTSIPFRHIYCSLHRIPSALFLLRFLDWLCVPRALIGHLAFILIFSPDFISFTLCSIRSDFVLYIVRSVERSVCSCGRYIASIRNILNMFLPLSLNNNNTYDSTDVSCVPKLLLYSRATLLNIIITFFSSSSVSFTCFSRTLRSPRWTDDGRRDRFE